MAWGEYIVVAVTDTGRGMTKEIKDQVFDPFFTTKKVGEGSGLGLSMVYGFVKQSSGHVTVHSEVGVGSTVSLYLPRSDKEETKLSHADPSDVARGCGETILVVEDDPEVRATSVLLIRGLGYNVLEAEDGPSALSLLESSDGIDLLFTDVVLPGGMQGIELATEIVRRRPGVAVLYTSGYAEYTNTDHGSLSDGVELLSKPFRRRDLARKIRAVIDNSDE